ncbi:uncharacterized protein THITE_114425 [Thermothielavioides terrestris NRRL 8126]|uniref:FAD-binding PCMH-type domain-containing protein n=1 Tax=Thermothielavioides terrestris (strain ATCC 38088 / NRRL 8126) TaxID=578455 RepID=G2REB1_THETT|nr:uncharacterized protein THITE_114425 [Thermothielavioides terrestris NRRL 8126]AEO70940.1 hypothetical protein THITE_114425 [Thermothielavioides terrestris NRRL 8126]
MSCMCQRYYDDSQEGTPSHALARQHARATTPSEVAEVTCQAAIASLDTTQAQSRPINESIVQENCFSIRSGGHSPNPTWSSIGSDGILVDLQKLNSVTVSGNGSVASVGSGARWGDVYSVLDSHGTSVIGAKDRTVGVGGSILGGGYHHLPNQFGLAADNVKNFEVVLSNGSIVDANSEQNSDLFWALKGGGPNFGVVTRYDLYTVPVHYVWVHINVYSPNDGSNVLAAFDEWQRSAGSDTKSNADIIISLDYIVLILVHSEPRAEPLQVFQPFTALQPIEVALPPTNLTLNQLSAVLETAGFSTPGRLWRKKALPVRQSTGANQIFVLQHVGQNLIDQATKNGDNALDIPQGPQQWWTTSIDWQSAQDDDLVRSVSVDTTEKWAQLAVERDIGIPFLYMNDAARDQNPLASYGSESLAKLKAVAKKYDPRHVFQTLQNGGFLLSRAQKP